MIRGLYGAAGAMMTEMVKLDTIANNLANVNTTGFKGDMAVFEEQMRQSLARTSDRPDGTNLLPSGEPVYIGQLGGAGQLEGIHTDYAEGMYKETQNPLDFALVGEGFFAVDTGAGIRYTRNGSFTMSDSGELVTHDGFKVLGANGPIQVPEGAAVTAGDDGRLSVDGVEIDQLQVVSFDKPFPLVKVGNSLFQAPTDAPVIPSMAKVKQGGIEGSNVSSVTEMIHMIATMRAYEAASKALQGEDELLGKAVNEVGRLQG
ncbi:MAG: flagellar basal-body rod protein FlgF [Candidatus Sericytochromatia bacterium]|nr:flagellar basal-body rod protein FlgF [Candidatus Sericytochromatia bacterium]